VAVKNQRKTQKEERPGPLLFASIMERKRRKKKKKWGNRADHLQPLRLPRRRRLQRDGRTILSDAEEGGDKKKREHILADVPVQKRKSSAPGNFSASAWGGKKEGGGRCQTSRKGEPVTGKEGKVLPNNFKQLHRGGGGKKKRVVVRPFARRESLKKGT